MKTWKTENGISISRILSGRSNVFLLSGRGINILVDTGPGGAWRKLRRRLKTAGIMKIDFLILTHTHYDHAENSAKIRKNFHAKVIVNRVEGNYLERGDNIIPDGTNFFTLFLVGKIAPAISFKIKYEPCIPDILVDQFLDLKDIGFDGYVMHTPGHTAGSQSIIVNDEIALVGDTMFGIFPRSIFPPFADNTTEMVKSWAKLLQTNCRLFLPSHGSANKASLVQTEYKKRTNSGCSQN
jgi:hydroxyacylglutathione hydrolase